MGAAGAAMGQAARRAGLNAGEYQQVTESLRQAGLSAQQSQALIQNFSRATAELQQVGSERVQKLLKDAGPQFQSQMISGIVRMGELKNYQDQLRLAQKLGDAAAANEFRDSHNARMAAYRREQVLQDLGAQELLDAHKQIGAIDESRARHLEQINASQEELNDALTEERLTREEIYNEATAWSAGFETKIVQLGNLIETSILDRMRQTTYPGFDFDLGPAAPNRGGASYGPSINWGWGNILGWSNAGGAQRFSEDKADVLGLAPGSLGYGDISKGWRRSTNIEGEKTEDQTREVDTNTEHLHNLNLRLQRWLERMGAGSGARVNMARGGVVRGPTRALVGEAGTEAVVTPHGTTVVSKPTHTVLGADGPATVIPLRGQPSGAVGAGQAATGAGAFTPAGPGTATGAISNEAMSTATSLAKTGNVGAVKRWMHQQGVTVDENWCGEFVAATIKASGGTPPPGYATASSYLNMGTHVDPADVQPNDVAVFKYGTHGKYKGMPVPPGEAGSHVGMVGPSGYDPKSNTFDMVQGNTLAAYNRSANGIEFRRPLPLNPETAMAEGGTVEPHVPPRSLFSQQQFSNYLARTDLLSNPITDVSNAIKSGWSSFVGGRPQGASTPGEALRQALPSYERFQQAAGAVLSPVAGLIDTTMGRAYAGVTGMPRAKANEAAELAGSAVGGLPGVLDMAHIPAPIRFGLQGAKQAASLAPPQLGSTSIEAFAEENRREIDRSAGGGGDISGTMTIEQRSGHEAKPRREPLFRPAKVERRATMMPAQGGPSHERDDASSIAHGW